MGESVTIGVKGRWVRFGTFQTDGGVLDQLRSHPPTYRRDGSRPVFYGRRVDDIEMFSFAMELKYYF